MRAYTVKVIDAAGGFHRYIQLCADSRSAEQAVWRRFGAVRMMSIVRTPSWLGVPRPARARAA